MRHQQLVLLAPIVGCGLGLIAAVRRMETSFQRHQGERRAVLLVVIIQGIIPPGPILFLQLEQHRGQVILVVGTVRAAAAGG